MRPMSIRPRARALAFAMLGVLAASPHLLRAQRSAQQVPPFYTKLLSLDTLLLHSAELSPDGRWVTFVANNPGRETDLWVMPAAGGPMSRLTSGTHPRPRGSPAWFPAGNRIAFLVDGTPGVFTLDFDPRSGRAVGTPKRVSVENVVHGFHVSPDGQRIAYATWSAETQRGRVRVIPSNGGAATTVFDAAEEATGPRFSAHGDSIYFAIGKKIVRVAVGGGPLTTVLESPALAPNVGVEKDPPRERALISTQQGERVLVLGFRGDTLANFPVIGSRLGDGTTLSRITADGRSMLALTSATAAAIQVVPVAGGPSRRVGEGRVYEWPMGWSPDNQRVYYADGRPGLTVVGATGGARSRIDPGKSMSSNTRLFERSRDERYWVYVPDTASPLLPLRVYDTQTHTMREITRSVAREAAAGLVGPGGGWKHRSGDEVLYVERKDEQLEVRAASPTGASRLLRTFPAGRTQRPKAIAVHGDRIAYAQQNQDSTTIFIARGPSGAPKRVASVRGRGAQVLLNEDMAWSRNGRMLAIVTMLREGTDQKYQLVLLNLSESDDLVGSPRVVDIDGGYEPTWTPDDRAVLLLEFNKAGTKTWVERIPVSSAESAQNVTPNVTGAFWGYEMSPDGKYVALPVEEDHGSTLWRLDLEAAIRAYQSSRARK